MNLVKTFTNYIKSSFEELKRVVWPSRKKAIMLTVVVIAVSLVLGLLLAGLDSMWRFVLQKLILKI